MSLLHCVAVTKYIVAGSGTSGILYFFTTQSRPPCQGLVGNLLWEKGRGGTLSVLSHTHLEFFPRCHKGTILSSGKLWGQVHPMDYVAAAKRSRCAWVDESVPYPTHQVGYQRFREKFGAKVLQLSAQIHSGGNGVPQHLLAWYGISICCQNVAKIEQKFKQKKWDFGFANQKQGKGAPNHRTKDTTKAWRIKKNFQIYKQRTTLQSWRRKRENGVSSIRAPLRTPVSVGPSSH